MPSTLSRMYLPPKRKKMDQQPCSPGSSPVEIRDCIEELLKFTLQSHIHGTLLHDLHLSQEFCSHLLNADLPPPHLNPTANIMLKKKRPTFDLCFDLDNKGLEKYFSSHLSDSLSEVSRLYKDLALALWKSISEASCGSSDNLEDKEEWNESIAQGGAELVNVLKTVNYELHVQEPFFTQIKDGLKTVEGRCATGDYNRIQPGDLILFNKCLLAEVQDVCRYPSFSAMLEAESLSKVLPGVKALTDGVEIYRKFYSEEKELSNGVLGIHVKKSVFQPYVIMSRIISGLSYKGIQCFLGFASSV